MKQQDKIFMVVGSTAVLVAAGITGVWLFGKSDTTASTSATTASTEAQSSDSTANTTATTAATDTATSTSTAASSASYKDGTYNATISYTVPHGYSNSVMASITISGGKITAADVNNDYSDNESGMYIDSFTAAIKNAVVGQSIDGLSLSRIGGASLTTQAFDDALSSIRNDAKA